jgi:hypothetical protein
MVMLLKGTVLHFKMVEVQTTEVDAIYTPVSLAQQLVKIDKHCWDRHECIEVKLC